MAAEAGSRENGGDDRYLFNFITSYTFVYILNFIPDLIAMFPEFPRHLYLRNSSAEFSC